MSVVDIIILKYFVGVFLCKFTIFSVNDHKPGRFKVAVTTIYKQAQYSFRIAIQKQHYLPPRDFCVNYW